MPTIESLANFWSSQVIATNALVFLNLLGALLLGLVVGYERTYHGRAAGMRTYGLVCMSSAALIVICAYPGQWFGGINPLSQGGDPTRVIQGVVTGIGFLCAGVIMREGFNISGLTTAASLWSSSVIGILVGIGFYAAAISLALLSAICMVWISKLEGVLPSRQAVAIRLLFEEHFIPEEKILRAMAGSRGYDIAGGSVSISLKDNQPEWQFVAVARSRQNMVPISELALEMSRFRGVKGFHMSYARN